MKWADQSDERQLLDIERKLGADQELRRGFARLQLIMAIRAFSRRGPGRFLAGGVGTVVGSIVLFIGLAAGSFGGAGIAALVTAAVLAGAVAFALVLAVLDHQASPPR